MIRTTGPATAFAVFLPQRAGGFRIALDTVRPTKSAAIAAMTGDVNAWRSMRRGGAFAGRVTLTPIAAPPARLPPSSTRQPGLFDCQSTGDIHAR